MPENGKKKILIVEDDVLIAMDLALIVEEAGGAVIGPFHSVEAALAAMTTAPAEIWGIADTYGKIAPGYDADLVVWDGDPLELTSYPDHVFIRGEEMPKESRQLLLRDRYLDLPEEGERSPAYRRP